MTKMMDGAPEKGRPIRPALLRYFRQHIGVTMYLDDIMSGIGEADPRRVQSGIGNFLREDPEGQFLTCTRRGQAWVYRPPAVPPAQAAASPPPAAASAPRRTENELFERLGELQDGSVLLRDESSNIWTARRM